MKALFSLILIALILGSCSEDPFFDVEPPVALQLKEQLQADESEDCPSCRPLPPEGEWTALEKEQLQDQDQDCYPCRSLPPGGQEDPLYLLKEQLQGGEEDLCGDCSP